MGRQIYVQNSLNGGVLSPYLHLRSDLESYINRTNISDNFISLPYGGARTRPGTRFVAQTKDNGTAILVPFEYGTAQRYMLEFGNLYMRVYKADGRVIDVGHFITNVTNSAGLVQITAAGHGLSTGNYVSISQTLGTQAINREWIITVVDANNFTLNGSVYNGGWTSGGILARPYQIATPYTTAQLAALRWAQSSETLYLAHPLHAPRSLTRTSDIAWTLSTITFIDGPYHDANIVTPGTPSSAMVITPSAATGAITLTSSGNLWLTTDVGRFVRFKEGSAWGYALITGYTSATVVNATVQVTLVNTNVKTVWRLGAFGETPGFPGVVGFYQQRLVWAATRAEPQRLWFSTTGSFTDMSPTLSTGTVSASDAVTYQLSSGKVNTIRWLIGAQQLMIGTTGEEFTLTGANNEAVSAVNPPLVRLNSAEGCADIPAQRVGNQTVFVQRSAREVRSIQYDFASDNFLTTEASLPAEHYFRSSSVVWFAYQARPFRSAHFVLSDGTIALFTFYPVEKVQGWSHIMTQGKYLHVAVMPNQAQTSDEAWYVVERVINGQTVRYVERDDVTTNTDCNLLYSGSSTTAVSGYEHLIGATVAVVANQAVYDTQTVTDGNVNLEYGETSGPAATAVEVGLSMPTPLVEPVTPVPEDQVGSLRGRRLQWTNLFVSVVDTMGLTIGNTELPYRKPSDPMDSGPPLFTGDKQVVILGRNRNLTFQIKQLQPLTAHVRGYFGTLSTED
ncbi:MAG: hypothetical protein ACRCZI_00640 [Cetobacterium sp.]